MAPDGGVTSDLKLYRQPQTGAAPDAANIAGHRYSHSFHARQLATIVSPTADRLTAASSPVAKKVELHTMSMEGAVMRMRPLAAIDIPAGQTVTLSPGGMHIMLLGLTQPLHQGQSFPLTLSFEHAGPLQVTVAIEKAGAMEPGGQATGAPPMHMHH